MSQFCLRSGVARAVLLLRTPIMLEIDVPLVPRLGERQVQVLSRTGPRKLQQHVVWNVVLQVLIGVNPLVRPSEIVVAPVAYPGIPNGRSRAIRSADASTSVS